MSDIPRISKLLAPYFNEIIERLSSRVPVPKGRINDMRSLQRKTEKYFCNALTSKDLDNPRKWKNFQIEQMQHLSDESTRIFTQDVNAILQLMHNDKKMSLIKLKPPRRKKSSSIGFHVEQILHFTFEDMRNLWERISQGPVDEYSLMFVLVVCTCCSASHLSRLVVSGIGRRTITITEHGLIHSILLEPCKTLLLRHVLQKKLNKTDRVFQRTTSRGFPAWLDRKCRETGGPMITPSQLVHFGRILMVLEGVSPYVAAILARKNGFSPLLDEDFAAMDNFLLREGSRVWKNQ